MFFELTVAAAAVVAGSIASVAGFGIGSVLTPLLALPLGTRVAVAAVSIPHLAGTATRFWLLRGRLDRRVFLWFGLTSAAGGLVGALLHSYASNRALAIVFGCLLLFAGVSELTGLMRRLRFGRPAAWIAGALSGMFGGLVGNQGGIRSAALLAFQIDKDAFVGTATGIGLIVDGARMPIYIASEGSELYGSSRLIGVAVGGVLLGTVIGARLLRRVSQERFRRLVALLLLVLGAWMVFSAAASTSLGGAFSNVTGIERGF